MSVTMLQGNCLDILPTLDTGSVNCCVTSPPYYGLRDYGVDGQIGLEQTPDGFVAEMVKVFREVWRVLRDDGTLWLNLGDSYQGSWGGYKQKDRSNVKNAKAFEGKDWRPPTSNKNQSLKSKDLIGIPWRVAFALQQDGWYLRQDIIWSKPNPMPESVRDRCTKAHEYIFLMSKSPKYYYDQDSIKEPTICDKVWKFIDSSDKQRGHSRRHAGFNGRYAEKLAVDGPPESKNKRSVWTVATQPYSAAHFATFPEKLIEPCILAGCPKGGVVLDPFGGSGTVGVVATKNQRKAVLIELNPDYIEFQKQRTSNIQINMF